MSYTPLPKNDTGDAILVEQKSDIVIDDSTPVEVSVKDIVDVTINQPVTTSVNNIHDEDNPVPIIMTQDDKDRTTTLQDTMNEILNQLKIMNTYNSLGHDCVITEEDIKK